MSQIGEIKFNRDHLVPESSIARSVVRAQSEKSEGAESVVYCHLVSISVSNDNKIITTTMIMINDG